MSFIYVNEDAILKATLSASTEHTLFPASKAGNDDQSAPFRWNAPAANAWLKADLNFMLGGGFEVWDEEDRPNYWTPDDGAGTLNKETVIKNEGDSSLRINGVKGTYQDLIVVPGKKYRLNVSLRGDGTNIAYLYFQDLDTLKWLDASNVWQGVKTFCAVRAAATWNDYFRVFTVEKPSVRRSHVRLRVFCVSEAAGDAYFDSFAIFPEVNLCSIHAHNIPSAATFKLQYDATGAFAGGETDAHTFIVRPRSFRGTFTAFLVRYVRLLLVEKTGLTPYLGEWGLGHYNMLGTSYRWDWRSFLIRPQSRATTPSGRIVARNRTSDYHQGIEITILTDKRASLDEIIEDFFEGVSWGEIGIIIVPDILENKVFRVRLTNVFEYFNHESPMWEYSIVLTEEPYPVEFNF